MKKLFLLLVLPLVMFSQSSVDANKFKDAGGSSIWDATFKYPMNDTTAWLNNLQYKKLWLNLTTDDSARFILYYQTGFDTTYFGTRANFDSVVVSDKHAETWDVSSYIGGFPFIRFFVVNDTVSVTDSNAVYETSGALMATQTYTDSSRDTARWEQLSAYSYTTLYVKTLDSARLKIYYQTAADTTSPSAETLIDSLVTTTNTGATDSWNYTPYYAAQNDTVYIRFIVAGADDGYGQGTTNNTFTGWFVQKVFGHDRGTYRFGYKREK